MHRWSLLLCLILASRIGCLTQALPRLQLTGGALREEPRLIVPANDAEQLLEQAAALLARNQETEAVVLLEKYLTQEPRHLFIRAQVAELSFQQQKWEPARRHFHGCVELAQELGEPAYQYLIHAHSRLVDIAEAEHDAYAEHLHRGIGLYELACHRAKTKGARPEPSVTSILGRAALSLQDARSENPEAARPHWYLHLVWSKLGQHQAARQALAQADGRKFFTELSPWEQRAVQTAAWRETAVNAGIGGERGMR